MPIFGKKTGPTGRKRDEYSVFANLRNKEHVNKPYQGSYGYDAYGQEGVKEAKRAFHRKAPHRWVKFSIFNTSRTHRIAEKHKKETQKQATIKESPAARREKWRNHYKRAWVDHYGSLKARNRQGQTFNQWVDEQMRESDSFRTMR